MVEDMTDLANQVREAEDCLEQNRYDPDSDMSEENNPASELLAGLRAIDDGKNGLLEFISEVAATTTLDDMVNYRLAHRVSQRVADLEKAVRAMGYEKVKEYLGEDGTKLAYLFSEEGEEPEVREPDVGRVG